MKLYFKLHKIPTQLVKSIEPHLDMENCFLERWRCNLHRVGDLSPTSDGGNIIASLRVNRCGRMIYVRLQTLREVCES